MSRIIRSKRDTPFVQIDKTGPEDKTLSWKAKGILSYILCKPDDWQIYIAELSKHAKDGKDSTRTGVNELIKAGYIIRTRVHDENGKFAGYDYQVHESPVKPTVIGKSENGKSTVVGKTVNGLSENGKTVNGKSNATNNNSTNNELTNNDSSEITHAKTEKINPGSKQPIQEELNWVQVARDMAEWLEGDGADQWRFMCEQAGGYVEPIAIASAWAGKYSDSQYMLRKWKKEACKLQNWIRNELKSNHIQQAKIKQVHNGKQRSSKDPLVTSNQLEQAYRELIAEGYK